MTQTLQPAKSQTRPILQAAEPQLYVSHVQTACDFYTQKLGFAVAFVYGDPPFYAQIFRDHARLNLKAGPTSPFSPAIFATRKPALRNDPVATAAEIKELFAELLKPREFPSSKAKTGTLGRAEPSSYPTQTKI